MQESVYNYAYRLRIGFTNETRIGFKILLEIVRKYCSKFNNFSKYLTFILIWNG